MGSRQSIPSVSVREQNTGSLDDTAAHHDVAPFIGMFSGRDGVLPVPELEEFLRPPTCLQQRQDRPYIWSCSVASLDGKISFNDPGAGASAEVALGHLVPAGRTADWRVLNAGWAFADAVLTSGAILRAEPSVQYRPMYDDLWELRRRWLKRHPSSRTSSCRGPINVVVTASGKIPILKHPICTDKDVEAVILTSAAGRAALLAVLKDAGMTEDTLLQQHNTTITQLPMWRDIKPMSEAKDQVLAAKCSDYLCLRSVMQHLTKLGVRYLDVSSGGDILSQLALEKLLDEMRLTITGQFVGATNLSGAERPSLFNFFGISPLWPKTFTHLNNPVVDFRGVRCFGRQHLFIRGDVKYRH